MTNVLDVSMCVCFCVCASIGVVIYVFVGILNWKCFYYRGNRAVIDSNKKFGDLLQKCLNINWTGSSTKKIHKTLNEHLNGG